MDSRPRAGSRSCIVLGKTVDSNGGCGRGAALARTKARRGTLKAGFYLGYESYWRINVVMLMVLSVVNSGRSLRLSICSGFSSHYDKIMNRNIISNSFQYLPTRAIERQGLGVGGIT